MRTYKMFNIHVRCCGMHELMGFVPPPNSMAACYPNLYEFVYPFGMHNAPSGSDECEIIISCQKKENLIKSFFRKRDKRTNAMEVSSSEREHSANVFTVHSTNRCCAVLTADGKVYFWPISFCHTFSTTCPTDIASFHLETRSGDGLVI